MRPLWLTTFALAACGPELTTPVTPTTVAGFTELRGDLTFRVHREKVDAQGNTHTWLQQVWRGVPVEGRDLGVLTRTDGTTQVFGKSDDFSKVDLSSPLDPRAIVEAQGFVTRSSERVLRPRFERRVKEGRGGSNADDYEDVVAGFEPGSHLEVERAPGTVEPADVFVRDLDGELTELDGPRPLLVSGTMRTFTRGPRTELVQCGYDGKNCTLSNRYGDTVYGIDGSGPTRKFFLYSQLNPTPWGDGQLYAFQDPRSRNGQTAAVEAHIGLTASSYFFQRFFHRNGWDDAGGAVTAYAHAGVDNAVWSQGTIMFGETSEGVPSADLEVIGHEYAHGVFASDTNITNTPLVGELGGIDEASADIFGVLIGFVYDRNGTNMTPVGNWTLGDRIGITRSLMDPVVGAWRQDLATAPRHYAGGPLARAFYFLSNGVVAADGSFRPPLDLELPKGTPVDPVMLPQRKSAYLSRGLRGLGAATAARIWYTALNGVYFAQVTNLAGARDAALAATMQLFDRQPNTLQYKAVEDAFAAVNIGVESDNQGPTITFSTQLLSATALEVTVDLIDPNGLADGTLISLRSSVIGGEVVSQPCASGHCVFTVSPSALGEGQHVAYVRASDLVGNETEKEFLFQVDTAPPEVTFTDVSPWPYHYNRYYTFTASDGWRVASARLMVDGVQVKQWSYSAKTVTQPQFLVQHIDLAEGAHVIELEVKDPSGKSTKRQLDYWRDRTGFVGCNLSVADTSDWSKFDVTVRSIDSHSGTAAVEILVDGVANGGLNRTPAANVLDEVTVRTSSLQPGLRKIRAKCRDGQDNLSLSPEVSRWVIPPCSTMQVAGGNVADSRIIEMGRTVGTTTLQFVTFDVHDRIVVQNQNNNEVVADTGCAATGDPARNIPVTWSGTSRLKVTVTPNCNPATALPSTLWSYVLKCPAAM
ncbi:MAG: M4 family metallopeptidase [Myxococcaceae bacterium]|nr:M4 family metallopeptidase [Myxococcaceae bacterium]